MRKGKDIEKALYFSAVAEIESEPADLLKGIQER